MQTATNGYLDLLMERARAVLQGAYIPTHIQTS